MSERLKKWKREQLQRLSKEMPATYHDVRVLLAELKAVERERDEREEAARSLLKYVNPSWKTAAKSQWPWLKETQ